MSHTSFVDRILPADRARWTTLSQGAHAHAPWHCEVRLGGRVADARWHRLDARWVSVAPAEAPLWLVTARNPG